MLVKGAAGDIYYLPKIPTLYIPYLTCELEIWRTSYGHLALNFQTKSEIHSTKSTPYNNVLTHNEEHTQRTYLTKHLPTGDEWNIKWIYIIYIFL